MSNKLLFYGVLALVLVSCTTTKTFPVSDVAPAAEIIVKQKTKKADYNEIIVRSKFLASPERISKNATAYVVWLVSEEHGTHNIGALYQKNGKNSELETSTPYVASEIFITAEKLAQVTQPDGVEISRVKL